MRTIDADELMEEIKLAESLMEKENHEFANSFLSSSQEISTEWWCVEDMVENAHTIYPEEIIHCKDCIHLVCYDYDVKGYIPYRFYNACWRSLCDKHWDREQGEYIDVNLDDYCSFAERK